MFSLCSVYVQCEIFANLDLDPLRCPLPTQFLPDPARSPVVGLAWSNDSSSPHLHALVAHSDGQVAIRGGSTGRTLAYLAAVPGVLRGARLTPYVNQSSIYTPNTPFYTPLQSYIHLIYTRYKRIYNHIYT